MTQPDTGPAPVAFAPRAPGRALTVAPAAALRDQRGERVPSDRHRRSWEAA
ncbi:hypothetical protein SAMN04490357_6191 [Streptomyces misionensis]|uniref:Uncharacterized protein n=1 Tax=Streptomyces misionensis TaxID=67331 RepID=A0A1H5EBX2_9ACTN|nr:hypothetical protein [Streptomyces misionensis]SED88622.1 hypothetical protein SAMN04490357_6191 [Streptomyces misionensis]